MLDKELKHRPFAFKLRKNTLEVKTQTICLLIHTQKIIDHFCSSSLNYYTTEIAVLRE